MILKWLDDEPPPDVAQHLILRATEVFHACCLDDAGD